MHKHTNYYNYCEPIILYYLLPLIFSHSYIHVLAVPLTNPHSLLHMCLKVTVPYNVFMNKVAARIPGKWKRVGTQMELTPQQIDSIDQQYKGDPDDCYRQVFYKWSPYQTQTWSELIEILRTEHVGEIELAQEIETNMNK